MVNSKLKGGEEKAVVTTGQVNIQTSRNTIAFFKTGREVLEKKEYKFLLR